MQPMDIEKTAVHTTPLNHIGAVDRRPAKPWSGSRPGACAAPGGIRKGAAKSSITFLHPKSNDEFPIAGEGVLIQASASAAGVINALG